MEENPSKQAGRDVPRSRTPRATFSTPDQPAQADEPAERAPRRAKAAPPVTFQPPSSETDGGPESPNTVPAQLPAQPAGRRQPTPANSQTTRRAKAVTASTPEEAAPPPPAEPQPAKPAKPAKRAKRVTPAKKANPAKAETPGQAAPPAKAAPTKTTPAKATPAKATRAKSTPAKASPTEASPIKTSPPEVQDAIPSPVTSTGSGTAEGRITPSAREARTEAWAQLIADPGHAPELLALAAVQTIGPRAAEWASRTRAAYPTATDAGLARLATRQFTRFGSLSSVFGAVAGSYAPIALIGFAALTHAELILHLAAAYGLDPADEERATELLVLTRVHPSRVDAEIALRAAKQPAYEETSKLTDAAWRLGRMAAAQTGGWAAIRLVNRFFPGTSLLVATLSSRAATHTVAIRANAYFSQSNHEAGSKV